MDASFTPESVWITKFATYTGLRLDEALVSGTPMASICFFMMDDP